MNIHPDTEMELQVRRVRTDTHYNMSRTVYEVDVTMLGNNVLVQHCIDRIVDLIHGYFPDTHGMGRHTLWLLKNKGVVATEERQAGLRGQYTHEWKTGRWEVTYETAGND